MRKHKYSQSHLAGLLIDGIKGCRLEFVESMIKKYRADPNVNIDLGYSAMHFCAGFENQEFAAQVVNLFLAYDGNPNVRTEIERYTPLHIACINKNVEVARLLIDNGADVYASDAEDNTPVHYATVENCFKIVLMIRNEIYRDKQRKKMEQRHRENLTVNKNIGTPASLLQTVHLNNELLAVQGTSAYTETSRNSTPSRIIYNFDRTSPYYINITHRKKHSPPPQVSCSTQSTPIVNDEDKKLNIFELTEENLMKHGRKIRESGKFEMLKRWQEKVNCSLARRSLLTAINDLADILGSPPNPYDPDKMMTDESFVTANSQFVSTPKKSSISPTETVDPMNDDQFSVRTRATYTIHKGDNKENQYLQVPEVSRPEPVVVRDPEARSSVISPKKENIILHWVEEYKHVDNDDDMIFKEVKILPAIEDTSPPKSQSSVANSFKLDTDYDTDALREELTRFGDAPGPITKSTKKLYVRKLEKYYKNPEQMKLLQQSKETRIYSVELEKALKFINETTDHLTEHLELEIEMVKHFQLMKTRNQREGKQKMSFIYLLLDPRELNNLSINHKMMNRSEVWQRFLKSIFYVGKGKRHRPYAHLYEAMRYFGESVQNNKMQAFLKQKNQPTDRRDSVTQDTLACIKQIASAGPETVPENKKLNRIVSIWKEKKGVVCLHVFHNITPTEAYTREAAIIDAIGISNLTNIKKGDYYGVATSWSMRQRKQLGVALLFKALHMHLIEGESQLLPSDLF